MKSWFKYLFIASLVFLVIALIRADYLVIPELYRPWLLLPAIAFACIGFFLNGLSWTMAVRQAGYRITMRDGVTAHGLSIFTKYIPGKIWVIMGRAEYVAKTYGYSRKDMASFSLDAQLISIWSALLLGTIGVFLVKGLNLFGGGILALFSGLSLVIYTPFFHRVASRIMSRILKREVHIPKLPFRRVLNMIFWYLLNWSAWGTGFWFMAASMVPEMPGFQIIMAFPLAGSFGIMAVFAPGGLGVREGVIAGFLALTGVDVALATTVGVASRLWFLTGEAFIFLLSLILRAKKKDPVNA